MKHANRGKRWLVTALGAAALLTASAWASATTTHYVTDFTTLNDSGVTGHANLTLNDDSLTVHISASGLQPNVPHPQHIHGAFDDSGNPVQSTTPTLDADANGDGVIELGEGQTTYGPILIGLTSPPGGATSDFPVAADGTIDFTQTYDLTDSSVFSADYGESDVLPLNLREIVLHGMNTPFALTDGGTDYASGEYDPVLPVASGELVAAVPEPAEWGMMTGGLAMLVGFLWLRRREDARHRHMDV